MLLFRGDGAWTFFYDFITHIILSLSLFHIPDFQRYMWVDHFLIGLQTPDQLTKTFSLVPIEQGCP